MTSDRDIVRGERCTSTGNIKGCGRRATWDRDGKPIVTLYAVANHKEPTVLVCTDCIARAGLPVPEGIPTRHERESAPASTVQGHSELTTAPRKEAREEIKLEPIAPVDEDVKVVPQLLGTTPVTDRSMVCAFDGCGQLAMFGNYYREPYTKKRKYFCSNTHLMWYTQAYAVPTDGTVQEEITDRAQHVSTGESQAAQLVRERYATWAKRARKWHAYLEGERAWSTHGRLLSVLTGAASTLAAATVAPHYAPLVVGALMIATALIAWRGQVAQSRLESSRAADAWVSADRLAEVYKGLVVELDAALAHGGQGAKWVSETLAKSQQIEGAARFGVPEGLRSVLVEVCK